MLAVLTVTAQFGKPLFIFTKSSKIKC